MDTAVLWAREGGVGLITLDRPAQHNAIDQAPAPELRQAVWECWGDEPCGPWS